jgi:Domain of unknown function (DUF4159)
MSVFIERFLTRRYHNSIYGCLVKRTTAAALLTTILAAGFLSAQIQEELGLVGDYADAKRIVQDREEPNGFVFVRLIYNGRIPGYIKNWYTDYPDGDKHLVWALRRLTQLDVAEHERAIAINDPELFRYPFVYTSEPGQMVLTPDDAKIMREYLERGGFWMLDDFWGSFEWSNMAAEMKKVLPDAEIQDIPLSHPLFHQFFDVDRLKQVPSLAYLYNGGITWEQDGFAPQCKGIWDKNGRLVVVINHNTDLGDAYEHMDVPEYPYEFSSYAYRVAVNTFMYALSH